MSTELEEIALKEFSEYKGKILLATVLLGYENDDSKSWHVDPPILVRVLETDKSSIFHWNDDWLDPYWDVELLEDRPEFKNASSFYVDGPSRNLNGEVQAPQWKETSITGR